MSGSGRVVPTTTGSGDLGRGDLGGAVGPACDDGFHRFDEVVPKVQAMALAVLNQGVGHAGQFSSAL